MDKNKEMDEAAKVAVAFGVRASGQKSISKKGYYGDSFQRGLYRLLSGLL